MSKLNCTNRKIRNQNTSIAIACTPAKAIENRGPENNCGVSSQTAAQPTFDFKSSGQFFPYAKFTIGNRIQFANAADLTLTTMPRKTVFADRKPIAFARQLAAAPVRLPVTASSPSLLARAHGMFLGILHRVSKQLSQRPRRKLQLLEIQQLGEKRFVGIVRVGKQRFLIGGAATSVSLLAEIDSHKTTVIASRPLDQETA